MHEFDFIASLLAPLAAGQSGALGLTDDAAILNIPPGQELVITKDAIVEGVHFIGKESPDLIARKLLRVNLSDLAAMGATPYAYFLALMLPDSVDDAWLAAFAEGLHIDQETFGLTLMGGDTTRTPGPLCLSATLLGLVPQGTALKRSSAKQGDNVYVSGTIGDGALGLDVAQDKKHNSHGPRITDHALLQRYQLPEPRVILGEKLRGIATACIDISDGLVQDLGHICECSHVGAEIHLGAVPLSDAAKSLAPPPETILTGGDDYELLFTAPPEASAQLQAIAQDAGVIITRIGHITKNQNVRVLDTQGKEIPLPRKGYSHF